MKKGGNKLLFTVLLVSLLFLISCKPPAAGGDNPRDTSAIVQQVQTGSEGVKVEIIQGYPPTTMYDQNELVALLEVKNKGNHDLDPGNCFVQATGFDPNIITGGLETGFDRPHSCAEGLSGDPLEGKNIYNTEGGFNQIEFHSPSVILPTGVFEYNPTLQFNTCYRYETTANPQVCIDPLFFQVNREQKTCQVRDISMGGGQGGPVGVSNVAVDMVGSKGIFEITVRNFGTGIVFDPNVNLRSCNPSRTDNDKVEYIVELSGGSPIDCKPRDNVLRMSNNQGKIVCSFNIGNTPAYETPLRINLQYGYLESYEQALKIVKTPE
jgi:hypothetical protein